MAEERRSLSERVKGTAADFKAFAFKGNVVDLAVGVMIGGAFGGIVNSLVTDILTPLIGALTGGVDFTGLFVSLNGKEYATLDLAKADNASTLNYGMFLQAVFNFIMIALCIYALVRVITNLDKRFKQQEEAVEERKCPFCLSVVDEAATRCPHCTSHLESGEAA